MVVFIALLVIVCLDFLFIKKFKPVTVLCIFIAVTPFFSLEIRSVLGIVLAVLVYITANLRKEKP